MQFFFFLFCDEVHVHRHAGTVMYEALQVACKHGPSSHLCNVCSTAFLPQHSKSPVTGETAATADSLLLVSLEQAFKSA